jgi:hypothetical protein
MRLGDKRSYTSDEVEKLLSNRLFLEPNYAIVPADASSYPVARQRKKLLGHMDKLLERGPDDCLEYGEYRRRLSPNDAA